VTADIDANGITTVTAEDKLTGNKNQSLYRNLNLCFIKILYLGRRHYTIINLVRVRYDGLSTIERLCHPRVA
jgi:hypothetical protein